MRCPALMLVLVLTACGGGGGGDGAGAGGSGGNTASGLVPAAPVAGAVLVSDATALRLLRSGATWIYRGAVQPAHTVPTPYTNVVTQTGSGPTVTEVASNALGEGGDSSDVRIVSGSVRTTMSLAELGVAESIDVVLLRSPVRALDQYTLFDRRVDGAVPDLDGDGKTETLDLAIYNQVVGEETLDLASRRGMRAVRVDTVTLARIRGTLDNTASETVRAVVSIWYAAGIGIVKTSADVPSTNTPGARDMTVEELDHWDGLTEGLGAAPPAVIARPAGQPGPALLGRPWAATRQGDGALMLTQVDPTDGTRFSMTRLSATGAATFTQDFQADVLSALEFRLLRLADGARLVHRRSDAGIAVLGFDASGARLLSGDALLVAGPTILAADNASFAAASTDNSTWVAWLRQRDVVVDGPYSVDLMLAGFGIDGAPLVPAVVLADRVDARGIGTLRLAAAGSRVLVSWRQVPLTGGLGQTNYAVFDGAGMQLASRRLGEEVALHPIVNSNGALHFCTVRGIPGDVAVVRLNGSFDPLRSTTGPLIDEIASPAWAGRIFAFDDSFCQIDDTGRLTLRGGEVERRWPWENNPSTLASLIDVELPDNAAPALATRSQRIARFELESFTSAATVVLGDRVLTLGVNGAGQSAFVLSWRPPR